MKAKLTTFLLLFSLLSFSQIPANYYSTANGTGYQLKTQLHDIIKNLNVRTYSSLWNLYTNVSYRDNYYENDGSLLDIYSENPTGPETYNYTSTVQECGSTTSSSEGDCYNREHLVPESFFEPYFIAQGVNTSVNSLAYYTKNDAHFIMPTDIRVNAWRGNLPFGRLFATNLNACAGTTGTTPTNVPCYTSNNSKVGPNNDSGYTGNVFEPIDEFKGDIARCVLYFATRYENILPTMYSACNNTTAKAMFDGSANHSFNNTFLNILLTWHNQDPVSAREIAINDAIYTHQNNRNPFIDHPEYVAQIWGSPLYTQSFEQLSNISVYPNPVTENKIYIEIVDFVLDEIKLVNSNGQLVHQIIKPSKTNSTYCLENIPKGFYFLKLTSNNQSITKKIVVN